MIVSIPPLKPDDEQTTITVEDELTRENYHINQIVPSDGVQISDDQYIVDPDRWFRVWDDFEDLVKIKY